MVMMPLITFGTKDAGVLIWIAHFAPVSLEVYTRVESEGKRNVRVLCGVG